MKGGKDELEDRGEPVEPLFRVMIVPVSPVAVFSAGPRLFERLKFVSKNVYFLQFYLHQKNNNKILSVILPDVELVRVEAVE